MSNYSSKRNTKQKLTAITVMTMSMVASLIPVAPQQAVASPAPDETLSGAVARMDSNLASLNNQAADIDKQSVSVAGEVTRLQNEYNALVPVLDQKQSLLKRSIRDTYVTGQPSTLQIVASNKTFSGVLGQQNYREQIGAKTKKAAEELANTKKQVAEKLEAAKQKQEGLVVLKTQLDEKITTAQSQIEAKQALQEATQGKEEEYRKIVAQAKVEDAQALAGAMTSPAPNAKAGVVTGVPSPTVAPARVSTPVRSSAQAPISVRSGGNNPYPYGQCTWYVYSQTGRGQMGNAGTWSGASSGGVGSILIMPPGVNGASYVGHVGVIVSMNASSITLRSMNWTGGPGVVVTHTVPKDPRYRYF